MKINKSVVLSFILLVVIASLYRIMPGRPLGFAPQIAMALFGGAVIKDRKLLTPISNEKLEEFEKNKDYSIFDN